MNKIFNTLSNLPPFFQAEDGIRDADVTGVQTCALPIFGDWGLGPIPNPQSPIPNPQSPITNILKSN